MDVIFANDTYNGYNTLEAISQKWQRVGEKNAEQNRQI
jgi:hypothetical protein